MRVLVTGVTGYIGGRLVPLLLEKRYDVYVMSRDRSRVDGLPWSRQVKGIIEGDLLDKKGGWVEKIKGFDVIYYLVHSLYAGDNFHDLDNLCAENFANAAKGIKHLIYLGGLVPKSENMSEHLKSREETGRILGKKLPVTEFRAGPIIGSGSAPFEMVRYLTERIPIMVTPKWIKNRVQPIAVRDILSYLVQTCEKKPMGVIEVGADELSFKDMMEQYAQVRGLDRKIIPLPVLTPRLSAMWVGLVTPIPNSLAVPLIEGVVHPVTANTKRVKELFPDIDPIDYREAVRLALLKIEERVVETHWSRVVISGDKEKLSDWEGLIKERHIRQTSASVENVFKAFADIGGDKGWPALNWAWRVRGWIDKLIGGPGLLRGKPPSKKLVAGDAVDFWRVEKVVANEELVLRAEMKIPGKAWLTFKVLPYEKGSILVQTAFFHPYGIWGLIYWYSMYPAHLIIFPKMIKTIIKGAEALEG